MTTSKKRWSPALSATCLYAQLHSRGTLSGPWESMVKALKGTWRAFGDKVRAWGAWSGIWGRLLGPAPMSSCLAPYWKVPAQSSKSSLPPALLWVLESLEFPARILSAQISAAPLHLASSSLRRLWKKGMRFHQGALVEKMIPASGHWWRGTPCLSLAPPRSWPSPAYCWDRPPDLSRLLSGEEGQIQDCYQRPPS